MTVQKTEMRSPWIGAALLAAGLLTAGPSLAADDAPSTTTPTCASGKVWDDGKKMCVDKKAGLLPDEALTDYASAEAREGRYADALATLDMLANPDTAKALNYRGYATRKLGRVEEGITYYLKSVALDANYTLVREYLGEAYLSIGRIDLAREQLAEIAKRGGTDSEPYRMLQGALEQAI